jgi:hypothetical protein
MEIQPMWDHQKLAVNEASRVQGYAYLFEMGCMSRDTEIRANSRGRGFRIGIEELYRKFNGVEGCSKLMGPLFVRGLNQDKIGLNKVLAVVRSGEKEIWKFMFSQPHVYIKCTPDHKIFTKRGWVEAQHLLHGDMVACDFQTRHQKVSKLKKKIKPLYNLRQVGEAYPYGHYTKVHGRRRKKEAIHRLIYSAAANNMTLEEYVANTYSQSKPYISFDPRQWHIHHLDNNSKNNALANLALLSAEEHLRIHGDADYFQHGFISWRSFTGKDFVGKEMTYDIACEDPNNSYVANNIVVHNTGKTRAFIETLKVRYNNSGRVLKTLIFTPPIVIHNFKNEWHKFTKLKDGQVCALVGAGSKRLRTFSQEINKPNGARIFITNYESLLMKDLFRSFELWEPEAIAFDESHKLKSPSALRSKAADVLANPLHKLQPLKYLLTGTPTLNTAMDLFQQFLILDNGETFGKNFWAFRARYFCDRNAGMSKQSYFPRWEIMVPSKDGVDSMGEIKELMGRKSMRVLKSDCLDLPPEISVTIPVDMSVEQRKIYDELKKDLITFYRGGACSTPLAITKALRLMQITSGFISTETPGEDVEGPVLHTLSDTPKIKALSELLETITESGHKVLVWAVWKENYRHIREVCEKLKIEYVEVHGGISEKKKKENVEKFKTDVQTKVFIGHPGSGGIGINLVEAAYSIFYSRTFSLEQHLQARARNHRGGSKEAGHEKITHYDLICSGTIDEICQKKLESKLDMSKSLLNDIVGEIENG